jgi:hypothetical protein
MARNLHILADNGVLLNFHEAPDLAVVPYRTTVEIDEGMQTDVAAHLDVRSDATVFHPFPSPALFVPLTLCRW